MGTKHWGKKEKLLNTSNFSFSHSVFKRLVSQGRQKVSLCGNGLMLHERWYFSALEREENILGKQRKPAKQLFLLLNCSQMPISLGLGGKKQQYWIVCCRFYSLLNYQVARSLAYSPFPTMFLKAFILKVIKTLDCVVKG